MKNYLELTEETTEIIFAAARIGVLVLPCGRKKHIWEIWPLDRSILGWIYFYEEEMHFPWKQLNRCRPEGGFHATAEAAIRELIEDWKLEDLCPNNDGLAMTS